MKLDELKTRVATARAALPAKGQVAKRAAAVSTRLKNNAKKGDRDAAGKARGKLAGKTPKTRTPRAPKAARPK